MKINSIAILTYYLLTCLIYGQQTERRNTILQNKLHEGKYLTSLDSKQRFRDKTNEYILQKKLNKNESQTTSAVFKPSVVTLHDSPMREVYSYNEQGKLTTMHYELMNNGNWEIVTRRTYTYNSNGDILLEYSEKLSSGSWVRNFQNVYTYDEDGDLVTKLYELWYQSYLAIGERTTYTYDVQGNLATLLFEKLNNNNVWENKYYDCYAYNEQGVMIAKTRENWNEGVKSTRETHTFDTDGNTTNLIIEIMNNGTWDYSSKRTYEYDSLGKIQLELEFYWLGDRWGDYYRTTYNYNVDGNLLTELFESYNGIDSWVGAYRNTYTYDSLGNRETILDEIFNSNVWENYYNVAYTYDIQGNILTDVEQEYKNGAWRNSYRVDYEYDANNNTTSCESFGWLNGVWYTSASKITLYYNNKADFLSYYVGKCNVEYITITNVVENNNNSLSYNLSQNYPNPFNPSTSIKFSLQNNEFVTIKIYDVLGKEIYTLVNEELKAGSYTKTWNAEGISSGVYFYKLQTGKLSETKKMILLR